MKTLRFLALAAVLTFSSYGQEAPPQEPPQGAASADAVTADYTCPMHPEVRQIGPGTCPECQMALVPTGGAASTGSTTGTTGTTSTTATTTM